MRFRDWFLLGAVIGLAYAAVRSPGTLACAILGPLLIVLLVAGVLIVVYWDWVAPAILVASVVYLVVWERKQKRTLR